ncbi:MAG: tripartite tricarboxylate transporter TctB family protein [Rhodospirillales bacterium]|nr:tripartite tricarboxylate transporter TctB family protein [Rhodospirillales bacterium]
MRRITADVVIAVLFLILAGVLFAATYTFQSPPLFNFSIRTWPRAVVGTFAILALVYLVQSLARAGQGSRRSFDRGVWFKTYRNVIVCFVLFALFLATLPIFGMLIGGLLFVYVSFLMLGGWHGWKTQAINLAVTLIFVGGMWVVFTFALRVILPGGILNI